MDGRKPKTTRYNDGTPILLITSNSDWATAGNSPGYCWYDNQSSNLITHGALYNGYTVWGVTNGNKNVCPVGWHVPYDSEFYTLLYYLDPDGNTVQNSAGGKMKEAGLAHWISPNYGATNESGFRGLAGGMRDITGAFLNIAENGYWWTRSDSSWSYLYYRLLSYDNDVKGRFDMHNGNGLSIRCLKD